MIDCTTIRTGLDAWIDGELPTARRAEIERHLASCAECRAEAEAIRSVLADTATLPRSVLPERDLWPGIESRLGESQSPRHATPAPRWSTWTRLAAAIVLMLLGASLSTVWQRRATPPGFAAEQARYAAASAALAASLAADPGDLAPATRTVVERNLAIIDSAIREAEQALVTDPGNTTLEQMLVVRYQQRLSLLQRAAAAGRRES